MASSCAVRSPHNNPPPPPQQQQAEVNQFGGDQSPSAVIFRRSQSRVFYDSEISTGTSWEFREIQTSSGSKSPVAGPSSHILYLHSNSNNNSSSHNHHINVSSCSRTSSSSGHSQLSVLRAPVDTSDIAIMRNSPVLMVHQSSSSNLNSFRGIIPSPTKEMNDFEGGNGSDGSRNSTGSAGSHRSQDSGFSDSGESRPSRNKSNGGSSSMKEQNLSSSIGQRLANLNSKSYNNDMNYSGSNGGSSPFLPRDPNRNYLSHNRSVSFQMDQQQPQPPQYEPRYESPPSYQQPPPPILVHHERFYSVPSSSVAPSPIPHVCGKPHPQSYLMQQQMNSFPRKMSNGLYAGVDDTAAQRGDFYGNNNNNNGDANEQQQRLSCVYEDLSQYQSSSRSRSPPIMNMCHQCVGNHQSSPSAATSPSQYSVYSSSISPLSSTSGHHRGSRSHLLGAPICSSTPKRPPPLSSNASNNNSSRVTIMQKIDNFESLNKNKKSLDNNNNNSNNSSSSSSSCLMMKNGGVRKMPSSGSLSGGFLIHAESSSSPQSNLNESQKSSSSKKSLSCGGGGRKSSSSSKLSLSSNGHHHHQSVTSKSSSSSLVSSGNNVTGGTAYSTTTVGFSCSGNKTVLSGVHHSKVREEDAENNNSSLSNSSQQSGSGKGLLPKGYKRVALKGLVNSSWSSASPEERVDKDEDLSEKVIIVKSHFDNDAMRLWLHELRSQTESECVNLLQTKSLSGVGAAGESGTTQYKKKTEGDGEEEECSGEDAGKNNKKRMKKESFSGQRRRSSVVDAIHGISSPMMSIKNVERMASVVSGEFAKICKNIEFGFLAQVPSLVLALISHVEEFLREFQQGSSGSSSSSSSCSGGGSGFGNLEKIENKLCRSCRRLNRAAENMIQVMAKGETNNDNTENDRDNSIYAIIEPETFNNINNNYGEDYQSAVNEVVGGIVTVGNLFSQVVDLRLTRDLSCILETVEKGGIPSKVALKSFATILADGGNHLCRLASEIRTVRGLLGVILDGRDDYDKIISLRCLATILCVGEAVKDFDRAGGFEIVADFMYERCYSLDLKIEAVSVLTQATDPWIDLESSLYSLGTQLEKIVVSLTCLIDEFKSSEESFLLVVAAISNLTFLEVSSIGILRRCNTVAILLEAVETSESEFSVFVLDHIATILANMAGVESCRGDIVKAGGVEALLDFLQRRPTPSKDSASEIMACERVQQKSTIAISRLCSEEGVAKFILERGGIHRLVALSRNEKERNYSDGVLIAALATLRKIISVCGDEVVKGLEAEDLIQPRLLDSFLLYSSRQESYV